MIFNRFKPSINDTNLLCQHYLDILYKNIQENFSNQPQDKKEMNKTHGEILYLGVDKIVSTISFSENDIFVDLGSGVGKVVMQVFLRTRVKEAIGIELIPELHQQAILASEKIQKDLPDAYQNRRKITLFSGSFFDISFETATVALISATCFDQNILFHLGKMINQTPSIHTVITLRPIHTLKRLIFKKMIKIQCSWDSALCYIYHARSYSC